MSGKCSFRSRELSELAIGSSDMVRALHFNEVFEGFAPETAGRNVWFKVRRLTLFKAVE